jgi:hypothetical protein
MMNLLQHGRVVRAYQPLSGQLTVNVRVMAGFVVRCGDNIERRVYPRIFTYSADYPEKYVLYCFS